MKIVKLKSVIIWPERKNPITSSCHNRSKVNVRMGCVMMPGCLNLTKPQKKKNVSTCGSSEPPVPLTKRKYVVWPVADQCSWQGLWLIWVFQQMLQVVDDRSHALLGLVRTPNETIQKGLGQPGKLWQLCDSWERVDVTCHMHQKNHLQYSHQQYINQLWNCETSIKPWMDSSGSSKRPRRFMQDVFNDVRLEVKEFVHSIVVAISICSNGQDIVNHLCGCLMCAWSRKIENHGTTTVFQLLVLTKSHFASNYISLHQVQVKANM